MFSAFSLYHPGFTHLQFVNNRMDKDCMCSILQAMVGEENHHLCGIGWMKPSLSPINWRKIIFSTLQAEGKSSCLTEINPSSPVDLKTYRKTIVSAALADKNFFVMSTLFLYHKVGDNFRLFIVSWSRFIFSTSCIREKSSLSQSFPHLTGRRKTTFVSFLYLTDRWKSPLS